MWIRWIRTTIVKSLQVFTITVPEYFIETWRCYLDLQLVLVVGVAVGEMPELLRLVEAPLQVLRGHEVLRHFYTVVDVPHLGDIVIIK
jgi:hypothetical protein